MDLPENFSDDLSLASIWMFDMPEPKLNPIDTKSSALPTTQTDMLRDPSMPPLRSAADVGVNSSQNEPIMFFDPDITLFCQAHFPVLLEDDLPLNNSSTVEESQEIPNRKFVPTSKEVQSTKSSLFCDSPSASVSPNKNEQSITFVTGNGTQRVNGFHRNSDTHKARLPSLPSSHQLQNNLVNIWSNETESLSSLKSGFASIFGNRTKNDGSTDSMSDKKQSLNISSRKEESSCAGPRMVLQDLHNLRTSRVAAPQHPANTRVTEKKHWLPNQKWQDSANCFKTGNDVNSNDLRKTAETISKIETNFPNSIEQQQRINNFNLEDFLNGVGNEVPASSSLTGTDEITTADALSDPVPLNGSPEFLSSAEVTEKQDGCEPMCKEEFLPEEIIGQQWLKSCPEILDDTDHESASFGNKEPSDNEMVNHSFESTTDDARLHPDNENLCDLFEPQFEGSTTLKDGFSPVLSTMQTPSRFTRKRKPITPVKSPRARDPTFRGVVMKIKTRLQDDRAHLDIRAYFR